MSQTPLLRLPPASAGAALANAAGEAVPPLIPAPIVPQPTATDDPLRGILLIVAASILFSLSDANGKYLSRTLPVIEIVWFRYLVFVLLALPPAARHRGAGLRSRRPVMQAVRGLAVVASALTFIYGLQSLPMADAAAINFVSPLFITILSLPVLGERVGLGRWAAVAVGLLGAVIAAQPGTAAFSPAAVFPVVSAATWAVAMVLTRRMAGTERPETTILWTAASGLIALSFLLPFNAQAPTWRELAQGLFIGVVASAGQFLVVLGYRSAPASLLAPFSYLQLIWSTALGYLIFNGKPGLPTIIGAVLIAASGLYSAQAERLRIARPRTPPR